MKTFLEHGKPLPDISEDILEEKRRVVFCWGRFNPPTRGHEYVFDKAASFAARHKASFYVFCSQTQDGEKNPLSYQEKIEALRSYFPQYKPHIVYVPRVKTLFNVVDKLIEEGFEKGYLLVGEDRAVEFQEQMDKYFSGKIDIKVRSAGAREDGEGLDPELTGGDDIEYVAASEARKAAEDNDFRKFKELAPSGAREEHVKSVFYKVRKALGHSNEPKEGAPDHEVKATDKREEFFRNRDSWNVGDSILVDATDEVGKIASVGSNFVTVQFLGEEKERKVWPWDVTRL